MNVGTCSVRHALALSVLVSAAALLSCDDGPADNAAVCTDATCVRAAERRCSDDLTASLVLAPQGTCAGDDGQTCAYPEPTREECGEHGVCVEGACVNVESLCDWPFGERISIQSQLHVGDQSDETDPVTGQRVDTCCVDFDGDGVVDDQLGTVFRNLRTALVDINPYFDEQIRHGDFNLLYDFRGLDDLVNDDHVEILVYESLPDYNLAQQKPTESGTGSFIVKQRSWLPDTRIPRLHLEGRIEDGHLLMDQGAFAFYFAISDSAGVVELPFENFLFDGTVELGPNGHGLKIEATLGGLIDPKALFRTLNNEVHWSCDCATFPNGQEAIDVETGGCNAPLPGADCQDAFCGAMTDQQVCAGVLSLFEPTIDSDGDGVKDRISAGLFINTTSAFIATDPASGIEMQCPE